jgi:hypothetical protein
MLNSVVGVVVGLLTSSLTNEVIILTVITALLSMQNEVYGSE